MIVIYCSMISTMHRSNETRCCCQGLHGRVPHMCVCCLCLVCCWCWYTIRHVVTTRLLLVELRRAELSSGGWRVNWMLKHGVRSNAFCVVVAFREKFLLPFDCCAGMWGCEDGRNSDWRPRQTHSASDNNNWYANTWCAMPQVCYYAALYICARVCVCVKQTYYE